MNNHTGPVVNQVRNDWVAYHWRGRYGCSSPATKGLHELGVVHCLKWKEILATKPKSIHYPILSGNRPTFLKQSLLLLFSDLSLSLSVSLCLSLSVYPKWHLFFEKGHFERARERRINYSCFPVQRFFSLTIFFALIAEELIIILILLALMIRFHSRVDHTHGDQEGTPKDPRLHLWPIL